MFQLSKEELQKLGAHITTAEVKQQPDLWKEAFENYKNKKSEIDGFVQNIIKTHAKVRVILTGAGTSAYVGNTVLPYLKNKNNEAVLDLQSIPTTNLVSNPADFFKADIPTILVSFARSGNSPESLAAVNLGKQIIKDFYQITITCAPEGKLAKGAAGDSKNLLLLMPAGANDQGFAMTGSYSCMTLTTLFVFDPSSLEDKAKWVDIIADCGAEVISKEAEIQKIVDLDFDRIVYLASGSLTGVANETQLKVLELTAGKSAAIFDSSLGFRHGPKSFVDNKTLVMVYVSNQPYTRQYDIDILKEISGDKIAKTAVGIQVPGALNFEGETFALNAKASALPDAYLALPYVVFGQILSLLAAIKVGNTPDTPSPSGTVNRVVKGVVIYDYK